MSDVQQGEQKKRGRKPKITVVDRGAEENVSVDDVIAKRLSGQPFGARDMDIPIKNRKAWALYRANSQATENRHYEMVHQLGWIPVTADDLDGVTPAQIGWTVGPGGILQRGLHGDEKLYKQPIELNRKIAMAKTEENKKGMGSAKAVKENVATAIGNQLGSEAGDFVHGGIQITGSDREGPLGA